MRTETYTQRILIPEEGHLLVNHQAKTVSEKVFLGINADASEWVEVTIEEAEALQKRWETEMNTEIE